MGYALKQETKIIDLGPELAAKLLTYNTMPSQRKIDINWVNELISRQKKGDFRSGEIGIAYNGSSIPVLVNGQHQCQMVVTSRIPIKAKLETWEYSTPTDLSNIFRLYDVHKARTQGEMVKVESVALSLEIPDRLANLIVSAAFIIEAKWYGGKGNSRIYTGEKVALLGKYKKFLPFLSEIFISNSKLRGDTKHLQRAVVVGTMIKTSEINELDAFVFWSRVRDGVDLAGDSPEFHLREFLKDNFTTGAGKRSGYRTASGKEFEYRCAGAWNGYRRKTKVKYMKYFPDKPVPKLI
jgi:hypothetical protein